ncbi:hypothetical protein [Streptomyces sp. CB03911]|uniref:hypothetical protein n=1 Tax=Streptomycetaceae TaxID=2062 RepID=UPI0018FE93F2|nr:hypothetical protein [Streptomyces sp. CB03911]
MATTERWLARYSEQLIHLAEGIDPNAAVQFVREVYEAGRTAGLAEAENGKRESE